MSASRLTALVLALFVCRAALGALVIPPWQGPDEPPHYVVAEQVAAGDVNDPVIRAQLERDVLESMARHTWWRGYSLPTPDPVPATFADEPEHLGRGNTLQPLYFWIAGGLLRISTVRGLEDRYMLLRALSIALGAATIMMAWAGTKLLFGPQTAAVVAIIGALHPQFLLNALSTTPDSLANAFGALVWWQGARFVLSAAPGAGALAIASATAGVLTKRNAVPLVAGALIMIAVGLWRHSRVSKRWAVWTAAACGAILIIVIVALVSTSAPYLVELRSSWYRTLFPTHPPRPITPLRIEEFVTGLIDSSWLVAGWLRYPAPQWWLTTIHVVTAMATLGGLVAFVKRPWLRWPIAIAAMLALSQIVATIANGLLTDQAPQGRYLFVMAGPLAVLLWIGFYEWWSPKRRWLAAPALVALMLALDITGWITTLLPAYA